jgi:hypothetical protein
MSGADGLFFDEEKFLIGLPFEVINSGVPGAYDIPAPPQGSTRTPQARRSAAATEWSGGVPSPSVTPRPAPCGKN